MNSDIFRGFWKLSVFYLVLYGIFAVVLSLVFASIFIGTFFSIYAVVAAILQIILGYLVWKKNFFASLIATILVASDIVFSAISGSARSSIKLIALIFLIGGTKYLWGIKHHKKNKSA